MPKQTADKSNTKPPESTPGVAELMPIYRRWLPNQVVERLVEETKEKFYSRLLPPILVLWGFIFQRLNHDHSCDAVWSYLSSDAIQEQFRPDKPRPKRLSESTSAYCQSRQRLPLSVAQGALQETSHALHRELGEAAFWYGHRVNLFDGSTLRLKASPELTEHYGVASNQHGPSHWPLMRIVAGFDLFSGVVTAVAEGPYRDSEHTLAVQVIRELGADWVHVGDRGFGIYHILQAVVGTQSDAVVRLKVTQAKRLVQGRLRPGVDLDVVWSPSRFDQCEADLPTPPIAGRLIYQRLEKDGFRPIDLYLFTTLTDREQFPLEEIVTLYGQRWIVELDLRHVKTTLHMEALDGKSVDIVRKELILGLLAYNLLRGLMATAAVQADRSPLELSLAKCWRRTTDACRSLPPGSAASTAERVLARLLVRLGNCVLPKRKRERFEPRAVWGRPRVYPTVKGSREKARQAWLDSLKPDS
jgi:IS4 transposase